MDREKLNILVDSEYSKGASGYSKIAAEIIPLLIQTGKYNVAEMASYCELDDPLMSSIPWKVYPTKPAKSSPRQEWEEFQAHPQNPHGRWKFNQICLHFKPDIILGYKDEWYNSYMRYFPFRQLYDLVWWNVVDGEPLENNWIAAATEADACFTYTKWGEDVLREACGNKGNLLGAVPLGVNQKIFYPIPRKDKVKELFGFLPDTLVVGFVCRNQPRKLIPMLMEAFVNVLNNTDPLIKAKTFLYLHTAWPDMSWNIPQLLKDYGIGNRVLFTYRCKACKAVYPTTYSDVGIICQKCGAGSGSMSNSHDGIEDKDLNIIYNFMDIYCQCSTNEGLGIPAIEAITCGVPTMVTDYSGTIDIIDKAGAIPIKSLKLIREMESGTNRLVSVPDVNYLSKLIGDLLKLPDMMRRKIGWEQRQKSIQWFRWDVAADYLMNYFDTRKKKNWKTPIYIHEPKLQIPPNLPVEEVVWWGYNQIIGRPWLYHRYESLKKTYELMMGITVDRPHRFFNTEQFISHCIEDNKFYNHWEKERERLVING